jgi:enoyl-CoA hydratase/carnithine racemase
VDLNAGDQPSFDTILYDVADHIATVTLNRPDVLNSFNQKMCDEFSSLWEHVRLDDDIHVVVLRAAGQRAFSSGMDRRDGIVKEPNVWSRTDPGLALGPKANQVWKPIICAIQGMCAGGAFYWINESDIVICSEDATFFDPHVTYGMVSALEPMGLSRRMPLGEVMRWALLGLDERMSAARAHDVGLVSEIVSFEQLFARAEAIAIKIARKSPAAVQGTVRAIWEGFQLSPAQAQMVGLGYTMIGNPIAATEASASFESGSRPKWELR